MPLTFTLTEGVLPKGSEKAAFQKLCEAMLSWHGLQGSQVMTPNVVGSIELFPREHIFSRMAESEVAFVEWKVPSFAFATREIQQGYIAEATQLFKTSPKAGCRRNESGLTSHMPWTGREV
jgi:hypothetical protein